MIWQKFSKKLRSLPNPLFLLPILKFTVYENSMWPTFKSGDEVLVWRLARPKVGDVVVISKDRLMVKRVKEIKDGKYFVVGDNEKASLDSRKFGWLDHKEIVGVVVKK
jgi:nickel-type superoxide dismutase maturation protease